MSQTTEMDVLEQLLPQLRADGYDVYLHPNKPLIPGFFEDFTPDAIALRGDRNLAIEVRGGSSSEAKKLRSIQERFVGHNDWELRVIWLPSDGAEVAFEVYGPEKLKLRLKQIEKLVSDGQFEPALLLAWATFEATARAVAAHRFTRPQTPGRIVQELAASGVLTPTEADQLRKLADKRNRLIHGDLQVQVGEDEVRQFGEVLLALVDELPADDQGLTRGALL
ncbi:hypothetical protein E2A64_03240 [Pseudohoeflea suaedae]|uniref:REase AHJR-like domain-containing protein n=1 Tax=Pseudohoeflea suaedae TaxID=877384 RepID=A0A4R5PMH0_9HYPH|nr:HepT-like ribonuclease domain-containing protein [Pseudohoeflea suaedae]TDH38153.1 hypothetical protein E2A64_03240 [Pseudohoeflea suaedae]